MTTQTRELDLKLETSFSEFEMLQKNFLSQLTAQPYATLSKLTEWQTNRQRVFATLKQNLASLQEALEAGIFTLDEAGKWQKRLKKLLETEERMFQALTQVRSRLSEKMAEMKKGKKALEGYKSGTNANNPVFFSHDA